MDYLRTRQNPLKGIPPDEVEEAFHMIATLFRKDWLEKADGYNPLQRLWKRNDTLSTCELFTFGSNLTKLNSIDSRWTMSQVRNIKSNQTNNIQGALFEINALGSLDNPGQNIKPSKNNHPGIDGILTFPDSKQLKISLKNYGLSAARRDFDASAETFKIFLKKQLTAKGIAAIQLLITTEKSPEKKDWKVITEHFPNILDQFVSKAIQTCFIDDTWQIHLGELPNIDKLHQSYSSYTILISAPFHKNEEKNLIDKINEACGNITRHGGTQSDKTINGILIHLPETASISSCLNWTSQYFSHFPEKPISIVMFYQATYATDIEKKMDFIHHCFKYVQKDSFEPWNDPKKEIKVTFAVGKNENEPTRNKLIAEINNEKHLIEVDGRYFYQRGEHYLKQMRNEKGEIIGHVNNPAPGIFTHAVFKIFPNEPEVIMQGKFPPTNELLIL